MAIRPSADGGPTRNFVPNTHRSDVTAEETASARTQISHRSSKRSAMSFHAAVRPDQMTTPTACDVYDVRGLLGHLLMAAERIIVVGQNGNPFAVDEHMEPLDDDAWTSAWEAKSIEAANAWADDASLVRPTALPWAPLSGAQAIGTYIAEFSVHTWDLATATGQTPTWDDEVLAAGLASIKGSLPATGRPEMFAAVRTAMGVPEGVMPDPYGPAVSVPDDAPLIDQLVAYNGRNPGQNR